MLKKKINIGIIGFGKMGQIRAEAARPEHGYEIKKIYEQNHQVNDKYPTAKSVDEILKDPDIDAVFVCLSNHLNKSTTISALQNGKHVFCEKPPAFNSQEVEEIRKVEKQSGKKLMYGFNHRQHSAVVKMSEMIQSKQMGRIIWMRGRYGKSVDADYLNTWRANPELAGGGILMDQGIHMLDLFLFLTGKPFDEVYAFVSNLYWNTPGIEDNVFAIMRNKETGIHCSLHSTMTQWRHIFSLEVFLEQGYMVLNGLKTSSNSYGEEELIVAKNRSKAPAATWEDEDRYPFSEDLSWEREATMFADCILNETEINHGSSKEALEVMKLIDKIYEAEHHNSHLLYEDLNGMKELNL